MTSFLEKIISIAITKIKPSLIGLILVIGAFSLFINTTKAFTPEHIVFNSNFFIETVIESLLSCSSTNTLTSNLCARLSALESRNTSQFVSLPMWGGGGVSANAPITSSVLTLLSTIYSDGSISAPTKQDFSISSAGTVSISNLRTTGSAEFGDQIKLGNLTTDPSSATNGATYYNTTSNKFRCYENSAWTNCGGSVGVGVSSNSIDWDELVASMTLDTNTDIALNSKILDFGDGLFVVNGVTNDLTIRDMLSANTSISASLEIGSNILYANSTIPRVGIGTNNPTTKLDVAGAIKVSDELVIANALQVGSTSTVSYSRFGTGTTTHANFISTASDLLISGDVEFDGSVSFDGLNGSTLSIISGFGPASVSLGGTLRLHTRAGDPTGLTGLMYYSTSSSSFRCFDGGRWKACTLSTFYSSNSINWDEIVPSMSLDTNTDIGLYGRRFDFGNGLFVVNGSNASIKTNASTNSTTSFQIASSSGGAIFNVDSTNDRIGIGTTAPTARLTVDQNSSTLTALEVIQREDGDIFRAYGSSSFINPVLKLVQRAGIISSLDTGNGEIIFTETFGNNTEGRIYANSNTDISRREFVIQADGGSGGPTRLSLRQGNGNSGSIGYEYARIDGSGFYASNSHATNAALRVRNSSTGPLALYYGSASATNPVLKIMQRVGRISNNVSSHADIQFMDSAFGNLEARVFINSSGASNAVRAMTFQASNATKISFRQGAGNDGVGYEMAYVGSMGFVASSNFPITDKSTSDAVTISQLGTGGLAFFYASTSNTNPVLKISQRSGTVTNNATSHADIQFMSTDSNSVEGRLYVDTKGDTPGPSRRAFTIQARDATKLSFRHGLGNVSSIGYEYAMIDGSGFYASNSHTTNVPLRIRNLSTGPLALYYGSASAITPVMHILQRAGKISGTPTSHADLLFRGTSTGGSEGRIFMDSNSDISRRSFTLQAKDATRLSFRQGTGNGGGIGYEMTAIDSTGILASRALFATMPESVAGFALCHETNGAGANQQIKDCGSAPSADYMEIYPVSETADEAGTIVMPSTEEYAITNKGDRVAKLIGSSNEYSDQMLGIVSVASEAGDFNSIGYNIKSEDNPIPIALNGRVKVKVSNKNGLIKPGDYITSSDIQGTGMKATKSGRVVGMALESSIETSDPNEIQKVMVFVNTNYRTVPSNEYGVISKDKDIEGGALVSLFKNLVSMFSDLYGMTFEYGVARVGEVVVDTVYADDLQADDGVTISDGVTGESYCMKMNNAVLEHNLGKCEE